MFGYWVADFERRVSSFACFAVLCVFAQSIKSYPLNTQYSAQRRKGPQSTRSLLSNGESERYGGFLSIPTLLRQQSLEGFHYARDRLFAKTGDRRQPAAFSKRFQFAKTLYSKIPIEQLRSLESNP